MRGRRTLFFLLILLTWYLAGMYHSFPLLVLSIMELLILFSGAVLCRRLIRNLSICFRRKKELLEAGIPAKLTICAAKTGRLPISCFSADISMSYRLDRRKEKRTLWGSIGQAEQKEELYLTAPFAGLIDISISRVRVYDWLSLCSVKRRMEDRIEAVVFPPEQALRLSCVSELPEKWTADGETARNQKGDAYQEIRQLREYRTGDLVRHIHWNLSARTEELWVKEYERENDKTASLFLNIAGESAISVKELDCFSTLVFAVLLGLLKQVVSVQVRWQDIREAEMIDMRAENAEDCRRILNRLYYTEFPADTKAVQAIWDKNMLCVNRKLEFYFGTRLIYRFSEEKLKQEIKEKVFEI